ncbi:hypothetical protein AWV79_18000 [Cupriavidus sp. UYMMa02A]|nr:hypothetical protein AWV80_09005 [Cupriavidus sp. UYMU48A]ODV43377.1 hypothetical protein AWV79_18000 [Cupriavidus sp. UYMMa02A]
MADNAKTLTSAQTHLAKYILDHSESVAFSTARQVGEAVNQSDATVVRFAKAIGYKGFSEMRAALREGLLERAGASGMAERERPSDLEELKTEVFAIDSELMRATERMNATALGEQVAKQLIAARRIWISGHGTTSPMAHYLTAHLQQITGKATLLNIGNGDIANQLQQVGPEDVVVGIGYVRYLPYTVDILRVARSRGAHIVAITDRPSSPLASLAHHTFWSHGGQIRSYGGRRPGRWP